MNEEPKNNPRKSGGTPPWLRVWVKMLSLATLAITIPIVGAVRWFKIGPPGGWSDLLPLVGFCIAISAVAATAWFCLWKCAPRSVQYVTNCVLGLCLFCRRNLRRALFGLACLATLVALFFAEEDWRGRHAWDQFRRSAETRGEYFELAKVVPPPVPDDQNFALTPVVASSYDWMIDRTGHAIWPRKSDAGNRLAMNYWADGDNLKLGLSDWTAGQHTELAFLQKYYRTLSTKTNLFPVPAQPQSPAADVLLALSRFDPAIADLRQAAQLPFSRFPLEYDKENPFEIFLPHLAALKRCTVILSLRATAELQTGQTEQAMEDLRLIERLTESIHSEPFLITHLVRAAMVQLMLQPVWEGLADHRWTDAQLAELAAGLARLDFLADYEYSLHNEQAAMVKGMDYLRQHPNQYLHLSDDWGQTPPIYPTSDLTMSAFAQCRLIPSGWFYQNQLNYDRMIDEFYLPAADLSARTFAPALVGQGEARMTNEFEHLSPYNIVGCIISSYLNQLHFAVSFAHGQSSVDLARVAMALERYRMVQGKYPASLAALTPRFMPDQLHDIIGGQPFHYRLTTDGQFVLYSVGWNEKDDGGVVVANHDNSLARDYAQGDWVWRYPSQ